ncbi:hypothetical protein AB0L57_24615 [Nocardia sp. NPDC052254]|uniref:hypothetical protein n=1 Tax=Nocardia sp. NPDC052254 TaxID=3155681 RepID=UPI00341E3298
MIVLAGATVYTATTTATAQATPLGCAGGYLGLGAAAASAPAATTGVGAVAVLLGASSATAVIFDQCDMLKDGQVIDIPAGASCYALDNPKKAVACPSQAKVYKNGMV